MNLVLVIIHLQFYGFGNMQKAMCTRVCCQALPPHGLWLPLFWHDTAAGSWSELRASLVTLASLHLEFDFMVRPLFLTLTISCTFLILILILWHWNSGLYFGPHQEHFCDPWVDTHHQPCPALLVWQSEVVPCWSGTTSSVCALPTATGWMPSVEQPLHPSPWQCNWEG